MPDLYNPAAAKTGASSTDNVTVSNEMKTFLKTTFDGVRSNKRTNALHSAVLSELLKDYPKYKKYTWKFEYSLIGNPFGDEENKFKVDIIGLDNEGTPKIAILCKCINSNYGKNAYNYTNCTIGESARILGSDYNTVEKILFVSIYPRVAPLFKKDGSIRSFDVSADYVRRTSPSKILSGFYGTKVEAISIFYDIENIEQKRTKKDFNFIVPKNITRFTLKYEA